MLLYYTRTAQSKSKQMGTIFNTEREVELLPVWNRCTYHGNRFNKQLVTSVKEENMKLLHFDTGRALPEKSFKLLMQLAYHLFSFPRTD